MPPEKMSFVPVTLPSIYKSPPLLAGNLPDACDRRVSRKKSRGARGAWGSSGGYRVILHVNVLHRHLNVCGNHQPHALDSAALGFGADQRDLGAVTRGLELGH